MHVMSSTRWIVGMLCLLGLSVGWTAALAVSLVLMASQ